MPILNVEYWEKEDGSCGLHFPHGIEAKEFARLMDKAGEKIYGRKKYREIKRSSEQRLLCKMKTKKGK